MRHILILAFLCPFLSNCQPLSLKGKIINEQSQPVANATITVKRAAQQLNPSTAQQSSIIYQLSSTPNGEFSLTDLHFNDTLIISAVGYTTATEIFDYTMQGHDLTIVLKRKTTAMDDVVVIAYGSTTKRLNTSAISRISANEIARQPVSNPLSVLEGHIPGLIVTQTNGLPGAAIKLQLRGQSSIAQGSEPLFIIDGIPFAPNNNAINRLGSAAAYYDGEGLSPFSTLNPADIESIEVLKDADATAIYGSRGANGVILITTKKGASGKTKLDASFYRGWSRVTCPMNLLNTQQYLQMRREAFANDGITPNTSNAYDLLVFDTTRYTNFVNDIIGGTASDLDAQLSFSGGTVSTSVTAGASYHRQTTVFPGSMFDSRGTVHMGFNHQSFNKKFTASCSASYGYNDNNLIGSSMMLALLLPPNFPSFFDSLGNLAWSYKGITFKNPYASLLQPYRAQSNNLLAGFNLSYALLKNLCLKTSLGYNSILTEEVSKLPSASLNPASPVTSASFGNTGFKNWIIEPQLQYTARYKLHSLEALLGTTFQSNNNTAEQIVGINFPNDALLGSVAAAATITGRNNSFTNYRYNAFFGRLSYAYNNTWLLNLTARRDGSSRFGPSSQWASFGSLGAGWIFSNTVLVKNHLPFLSFGKLRGSWGTTGNDQIGDYKYLDLWSVFSTYGGTATLVPTALFNGTYGWEVNRKLEAGLELGFFNNLLLVSADYFRNRSGNQLIDYKLPSTTGFTNVFQNFPASVQNSGWEFVLNLSNFRSKSFSWSSSFNISFPKNRLLRFPGLSSSSYANSLVIGEPLSVYGGFRYLGVDPQTGIYSFEDAAGHPTSSPAYPADWHYNLGNVDPEFYGGLGNEWTWKGWQLSVFFSFRKQQGTNYLYQLASYVPGSIGNLPALVTNRWQHPGDNAEIQKYTQDVSGPAYNAAGILASYNNSAMYSDASFIRPPKPFFFMETCPKPYPKNGDSPAPAFSSWPKTC